MVRMTQHDTAGRVYLKVKSQGGSYRSEPAKVHGAMLGFV